MSAVKELSDQIVKLVRAWESKHCGCDGPEETGGAMHVCLLHEIPGTPDRSCPPEAQTRIAELLAALEVLP